MAKNKNEVRVISVTREAFFALIEAFVYDKIRGIDPPEGYHGIIPDDFRDTIWNYARFISGIAQNGDSSEIILDYQNDTISRLHSLGYSYRVLDRRGDGSGDQLSLFEEEQEGEE